MREGGGREGWREGGREADEQLLANDGQLLATAVTVHLESAKDVDAKPSGRCTH